MVELLGGRHDIDFPPNGGGLTMSLPATRKRKKIAERKNKEHEITNSYIENDVTCGKRASHLLLMAYINAYKSMPRTFTKPQMDTLCKTYGIATRASDNKRQRAHQLMVEIPKNRCMLSPEAYISVK